ncbi:VOC family protein [Bartonella sp. HY761]|uniref:VOC family protein n=1 Tax=Bartonella sp. HY761 TaxID=2979330 RepID=UPI0021FDA325|nr:VOC family protein [Bartonella sp. HY761]UXN06364.1 VOC family protein [Bartonella sp. HY761]
MSNKPQFLKDSKVCNLIFLANDLDETQKFYEDLLGLKVTRLIDEDETFLIVNQNDGVELVFFEGEVEGSTFPVTVFNLPNGGINKIVDGLEQAGITIINGVSPVPGGLSADFEDCNGYVLSICQNEDQPL